MATAAAVAMAMAVPEWAHKSLIGDLAGGQSAVPITRRQTTPSQSDDEATFRSHQTLEANKGRHRSELVYLGDMILMDLLRGI